MGQIHILEENLINKIAAGEVVERPASVVKELVENSIDAGADQIFITLSNGGKDLISVLDNGSGMNSEDAKLSIERHATSKIRSGDDLEKINTMGFRGEALAAISSVSRFELTTCQDESVGGYQMKIEGGKLTHSAKIGFPQGTRISIENLFYNLPARQKFLKSLNTEYQHIYDLILRLSLGHPKIQFRLTHNKKMVINLGKGESFEQRVKNCFGAEIAKDLIWMEHSESYLKFSGLFSNPNGGTRPSKRWQHCFVNQRYVRCQPVSHAISEGYKTLIMKNQHPMFFCNIEINPAEIDVNVHPAKTEIRLKNARLVNTIIATHIQKALKEATRKEAFKHVETLPPLTGEEIREMDNLEHSKVMETPFDTVDLPTPSIPLPKEENSWEPKKESKSKAGEIFTEVNEQLGFSSKAQPRKAPASDIQAEQAEQREENPFLFNEDKGLSLGALSSSYKKENFFQVIGQLQRKYILAQDEGRLILVDQHSAHERVRFEEIRNEFYQEGLSTHSLLIPLMVEFPPQDGLLLEQHMADWAKLGFEIEPFGGNDYRISQIPAILKDKDIATVIKDILDEMAQFGRSGKLEIFFNEVFEKMACHSAIRAGQSLNQHEMQALLNQLAGLDLQLFCPHGRPVLIDISLDELDKRFKRIV